MQTFRTVIIPAAIAILASATLRGEPLPATGHVTLGLGGSLQDGDRARFQSRTSQAKHGAGGIEDFFIYKETSDTASYTLEGRLLGGNNDYLFDYRWVNIDQSFLSLGYREFRVWNDGSGGYFPGADLWLPLYDEVFHLDRSRFWVEGGLTLPGRPHLKLRYERHMRKGRKGSTHLADTNLAGAFGTRSIVPTFLALDESRDIITVSVTHGTPDFQWAVGGRFEHSEIDNTRNSRRRPFEAADRYVTTYDGTQSDLFSLHGFYERRLSEKLTFSTGGMITRLDAKLDGSRIYGADYDAPYDPLYPTRQARDEGYYDLRGEPQLRQSVVNINLDYRPAKHWQIRPAIRIENMRAETIADFVETNVTNSRVAVQEDMISRGRRDMVEVSEGIEVRYTGNRNWTYSLRGEWMQGDGNLDEQLTHYGYDPSIDRSTDYDRRSGKYAFTTNWYVRPGLTFAGQAYYRDRRNDYNHVRDSTPAGTGDVYPAFITRQSIQSRNFNVRMTWRPMTQLTLISRYDRQWAHIDSTHANLPDARSSDHATHIISQSVTFSPAARLYTMVSANMVYDQVTTPAIETDIVKNADNNYLNGSVHVGYALGKVTDVLVDYSHYRANNFIDNSQFGMPYGANERQYVASVTWIRRHTDQLIYTLKYSLADYGDRATAGFNDFRGHTLYGKVQFGF